MAKFNQKLTPKQPLKSGKSTKPVNAPKKVRRFKPGAELAKAIK